MKLCRLYQTLVSLWLDERPRWPRFLREHVQRCPECSARTQQHSDIATQLQHDANLKSVLTPAFLSRRIKANLGGQPARLPSSLRPRWLGSLALISAALLLLALFIPQRRNTNNPPLGKANDSPGQSFSAKAKQVEALTTTAAENLAQLGNALEPPLRTELTLAMQDGRRVLTAMVSSFVPTDTAERMVTRARTMIIGNGLPAPSEGPPSQPL